MPNYKETTITNGTSYRRAYAISINRPLNATPTVSYYEEDVINVDTLSYKQPSSQIDKPLTDFNESFPLLNPADDSVIGTASVAQGYAILYSYYRYLADKRDAGQPL